MSEKDQNIKKEIRQWEKIIQETMNSYKRNDPIKPKSKVSRFNLTWCFLTIILFLMGYSLNEQETLSVSKITDYFIYDKIEDYKGFQVIETSPFLEKMVLKQDSLESIEVKIKYKHIKPYHKMKMINDTTTIFIK